MAKKSSIEKNNRRAKLAKQKAPARARLKALARDRDAAPEERFEIIRTAAQQLDHPSAQPLCADRAAARRLSQVQAVAYRGARAGLVGADPRHAEIELVKEARLCR